MPYRRFATLQAWVEEFTRLGYPLKGSIRVIPQDGEEGADTGLVAMRLLDSPTEIYIEPPAKPGAEWTITFEPREQAVRLGASAVKALAGELATLSALCAFLQQKSEELVARTR
ncbi:hypothetical protein [Microbacterium sp. BK668]|uniref:hypothetical protein n=1 Tax=Microbacterium sp. BK668 TaxID=2512118 RepID=UPI00105BF60E|nr:hypothetical protein [Microbacterium sp. BK668]TDN90720.1 hypothetical protein EV279_0208 [Microbacterium sp. BK668]